MKLIYRVAYYGGGFIVGLMLLLFFLSGKRASCDYSPNARVLKNIRIKERSFKEEPLKMLSDHGLDTSAISSLLINGDVVFSESETHREPCHIYVIQGTVQEKKLKIKVENCDSLATVLESFIVK